MIYFFIENIYTFTYTSYTNAINVKKEAKQLVVEECLLPIKKNFQ